MLNIIEASLDDTKVTCKKATALFTQFIGNYMLVIISCQSY